MSLGFARISFVMFFASAVAGCNSAPPPQPLAPQGSGSRGVPPAGFKLPEGSGCSGSIARYRAIMDNDLAMGHVNQAVYNQIQNEIGDAESACSAGQEARALTLVHASKARHGYPG
ncbi:MAG TPA: hypothetical protein VIF61_12710 [Methylocystis sp.]|jgi:hypothetical protein